MKNMQTNEYIERDVGHFRRIRWGLIPFLALAITVPVTSDGELIVSNDMRVVGNTTLESNMYVVGSASFASDVEVTGTVTAASFLGRHNVATGVFAIALGGMNNIADGYASFVGGGTNNIASGPHAVIAGGGHNRAGSWATVGGGFSNRAIAAWCATIAGGNINTATGSYSTIGGGTKNIAGGFWSGVGSGYRNEALASRSYVGGGEQNIASGVKAVIGGGYQNEASGLSSTVAGGDNNIALGDGAVVPGGALNEALGFVSFAAGYYAKATNDGAFVWADSQGTPFSSTASDQFAVRAQGGIRFVTDGSNDVSIVGGQVSAAGFSGSGVGLTGISGASLDVGTISNMHLADGIVTGEKIASSTITTNNLDVTSIDTRYVSQVGGGLSYSNDFSSDPSLDGEWSVTSSNDFTWTGTNIRLNVTGGTAEIAAFSLNNRPFGGYSLLVDAADGAPQGDLQVVLLDNSTTVKVFSVSGTQLHVLEWSRQWDEIVLRRLSDYPTAQYVHLDNWRIQANAHSEVEDLLATHVGATNMQVSNADISFLTSSSADIYKLHVTNVWTAAGIDDSLTSEVHAEDFFLETGDGGRAWSGDAGGHGGTIAMRAGSGGSASYGRGPAGNGGDFVLEAGDGGDGTTSYGGSANGNGGDLLVRPGRAGTGNTNGSDGAVYLLGDTYFGDDANSNEVSVIDGVIIAQGFAGDGSGLTNLSVVTPETDPIFTNSAAFTIQTNDITLWDIAYGWGNHATEGYLTSYTETDPVAATQVWSTAQYPSALLLDGSRAMTADLDMGGYSITNISTNSLVYSDGQSVREKFVDVAGDTMTGPLTVQGTVTAAGFDNSQNTMSGTGSSAVGGQGNTVSADYVTLGGGLSNTASAMKATIGGGEGNVVNGPGGTVAGGGNNSAFAVAVVGGGSENTASAAHAAIGGGQANEASGLYAVVAGGLGNTNAAYYATISGGSENRVQGMHATVAGGGRNEAYGSYSMIAGGSANKASGNYSFAAGRNAQATNDGAFVWADSSGEDFASLAENEFAVRASGGVRFVTDGSNDVLISAGQVSAASFTGDGSGLTNLSVVTTETDPIFTNSAAFTIATNDITLWNIAYGWGNHSAQGYLTNEVDPHALLLDGSRAMTADLDMGGYSITNISTNSLVYSDGQSVRQKFVDSAGDTMSGALTINGTLTATQISLGGVTETNWPQGFFGSFNDLTDVPAGLSDGDDDVQWSGTSVGLVPSTARASLQLGSAATNAADAFAPANLASYAGTNITYANDQFHAAPGYTDAEATNAVAVAWTNLDVNAEDDFLLSGSRAMEGDVDMATNRVTAVADPVEDRDAVNKQFLRSVLAYLPPQGDLSMGVYTNGPAGDPPLDF